MSARLTPEAQPQAPPAAPSAEGPWRVGAGDDVAAVLALAQEAFAGMAGRIDPPSSAGRLTVATVVEAAREGEVWAVGPLAAPLACVFLAPRPADDVLYLGKLAVAAGARGRGLARRLVALADARARALGLGALELQSRVELVEVHAAFRALGFERVGATAHPGYDRPTSITMRRPLAPPRAGPGRGHGIGRDGMKTIGILGGMSAVSTAIYYQRLNRAAAARLGGLHSAEIILRSVDFAPIAALQETGDWAAMGARLNREALGLERAGAGLILLATNTMHKVADRMMAGVAIPMIHIADATAGALVAAGHRRPALMATAYTMEQDFYLGRLRAAGLDPLVPDEDDRAETHRIIYEELVRDVIRAESRTAYEAIAGRLAEAGADSLILGTAEDQA
ncbi:MAG: amino acid racemase, partial [Pseudomonadota bacterium]